jgi:hypothetical protein
LTDKGRPERDDEEETIAGGASTPGSGGTQGDFGLDDLESLPGRRAKPAPKPAAGPAPETPPDATSPDAFAATTPPAAPDATVADSAAVQKAKKGDAEVPTREMDVERELPTIVGSFAASKPARPPAPDEMETIADAGPATDMPTGSAASKSAVPAKKDKPFVSPLSNVASRTARDPIVGSAATRGTHSGVPAGPHVLAEGQLLADRYELMERLGKGGMGEVWKARHILLQGHRAIKVIKASISRDPAFRQRFLQEGQTMMRVKHPGVVEVTDLDETRQNRELFMVMEYLQGRTIYDAVRDKTRPLSGDVRDAVRILIEVANGMQRIHDERIVHKDLKSDNVLLVKGDDGKEHPKVIDFGLAKRLGDRDLDIERPDAASPPPGYDPDLRTTLSGTLAYMAPEQFRNQPSSFQSDVYAFGVMAYEVFSGGEFPLPRGSLVEYMRLHEAGKAPDALATKRPDLDPKLAAIFDGCLSMKREARPESFKAVAKELQYWLDTPERLARRRKQIYSWTGTAVLAASAVWGFFFSGRTASLSPPKLFVAESERQPVAGVWYLRGEDLAALRLQAGIEGKPDGPVVEIDGSRRDGAHELRDKTLVGTVDLSDLPDGPHALTWRAAPGASAAKMTIDVDRSAPKFRGVAVSGSVVGADGVFSRAQSPEVVVDLDEAGARIAEVVAKPANAPAVKAQRDGDTDRWILKGTSDGDGPVTLDVVARDWAGNESRSKFSYVRDTETPFLTVVDEYEADARVPEVHVRGTSGQRLDLGVGDFDVEGAANGTSIVVAATFAGRDAVEKVVKGRADVTFDLPDVPADGLATKLVIKDAAGNRLEKELLVRAVRDDVIVTDGDRKNALTIGPSGAASVVFVREYAVGPFKIGDPIVLTARQLLDASGEATAGATPRKVDCKVVNAMRENRIVVAEISAQGLAEGTYEIGPAFLQGTRVTPYRLTIDGTPPRIESCSVKEKSGRALGDGDWALSADLVVTATIRDLSPFRVTFGGRPPVEKIEPGRRVYTFADVRCDREGANSWPLVVSDGANQSDSRTLSVNADWSTPEITALDSPRNESTVDDVQPVKFVGRCSEAPFRLEIEGLPGATLRRECSAQDFGQEFTLPPTEGPVALRIVAIDPAGHRSAPRVVTLSVVHRATIRAAEITWTRGVETKMEKVEQGDVVLAASAAPVREVFVDKTEVTNAQYRAFLAAVKDGDAAWRHPQQPKDWSHVPPAATWSDPKWNADDLPVVNVAYWDAYAFAKWTGRRLPTEAEWVKAASKKTGESNLRQWPAFAESETWKDGVLATSESVKGPVSALKGADVSPCGCLHMGGNVSEWVELASPAPDGAREAGTRGGNWYFTKRAADVRNTPAKAWDRSFRERTIGFRCAIDADQVIE